MRKGKLDVGYICRPLGFEPANIQPFDSSNHLTH